MARASGGGDNSIRIRVATIVKLCEIVGNLKPAMINKWVVPLALKGLGENKPDLKSANNRLCVALYEVMGGGLIEAAMGNGGNVKFEDIEKLKRIVGIF